MRLRVTSSATAELLETVVRLRRRDRAEAARFVAEVERRLAAIAGHNDEAPEMGPAWRSAGAAEGHRLYIRERGDTLWLLAVWPDPGVRE